MAGFKKRRGGLAVGLLLALVTLVLYLPGMARLFFFEHLPLPDLLTALALGGFSVFWFEGIKLSRRLSQRRSV